ncbi:MAG: class I SAM-dependent methyltransferase [Bacteriovorax sp.]|nr:class I SAM-dependent methyltransferase [Bacteriovorax sp.]
MKKEKEKLGATGFSIEYWDVNYKDADEMDNIVNAKEHATYIKAILGLEYIDVSSVVDLGFGLGILFKEVLKIFQPYRALGIEPSLHPFELMSKKKLTSIESTKLSLENIDLVTWAKKENTKTTARHKTFDLGICTSVFQYLSDEEIEFVLPIMAKRIRYLYFSVPTNLELRRQIEDLEFKDEYAIHRTREKYLKMIRPHFTFVSSRLLESKIHFTDETTNFTDLLFRF